MLVAVRGATGEGETHAAAASSLSGSRAKSRRAACGRAPSAVASASRAASDSPPLPSQTLERALSVAASQQRARARPHLARAGAQVRGAGWDPVWVDAAWRTRNHVCIRQLSAGVASERGIRISAPCAASKGAGPPQQRHGCGRAGARHLENAPPPRRTGRRQLRCAERPALTVEVIEEPRWPGATPAVLAALAPLMPPKLGAPDRTVLSERRARDSVGGSAPEGAASTRGVVSRHRGSSLLDGEALAVLAQAEFGVGGSPRGRAISRWRARAPATGAVLRARVAFDAAGRPIVRLPVRRRTARAKVVSIETGCGCARRGHAIPDPPASSRDLRTGRARWRRAGASLLLPGHTRRSRRLDGRRGSLTPRGSRSHGHRRAPARCYGCWREIRSAMTPGGVSLASPLPPAWREHVDGGAAGMRHRCRCRYISSARCSPRFQGHVLCMASCSCRPAVADAVHAYAAAAPTRRPALRSTVGRLLVGSVIDGLRRSRIRWRYRPTARPGPVHPDVQRRTIG